MAQLDAENEVDCIKQNRLIVAIGAISTRLKQNQHYVTYIHTFTCIRAYSIYILGSGARHKSQRTFYTDQLRVKHFHGNIF